MLDFFPIYKRELKTFFQSASTYVILALYFFIMGLIFARIMIDFSDMSRSSMMGGGMMGQQQAAPNVTDFIIRQIFNLMASLVMFTVPILSMRLVAEEKNRGTFELLVSCPIGDWSILMGKYLALVTVGAVMVAMGSIYPFLTWWAGRPSVAPEWPIVVSCALGMLLIFASYAAFGVMASAFSDNQMTAAVITLIGLIVWNIFNIIGSFQSDIPLVRDVTQEIGAFSHTESFLKGVLTLKDVAYYILMSFLFLFVASKTLDARRWRI